MESAFWRKAGLATLLAFAVFQLGLTLSELPKCARNWDFSLFYLPALELRSHIDPYTTDLKPLADKLGLEIGLISHPLGTPTFYLLFEGFTWVRPQIAYWAWMSFSIAALLIVPFALVGGEMSLMGVWAFAGFATIYYPVANNLYYAQTQILIVLALAVMMHWLRQGRDRAAGVLLAFLVLTRGYPWLMAGHLLLRRRWTALGYTIAACAIGIAITMILAPQSLSFLSAARVMNSDESRMLYINVSAGAFVWRMMPPWQHSHAWPGVESVIWAVRLALLGLTVKGTLKAKDERAAFALWVAATVLIAPVAWTHYMVLLLIPFSRIAIAMEQGRLSDRTTAAAGLSYALMMLWPTLLFPFDSLRIVLGESAFVAMLLGYLSAYWFAVDRIPESAAEPVPVLAAASPAASLSA